jgi:hypothetical protein
MNLSQISLWEWLLRNPAATDHHHQMAPVILGMCSVAYPVRNDPMGGVLSQDYWVTPFDF